MGTEAQLCQECNMLEDEHVSSNATDLLAAALASATSLGNTAG